MSRLPFLKDGHRRLLFFSTQKVGGLKSLQIQSSDPRGRERLGFSASDERQVCQLRGSSRLGSKSCRLKFACVLAYTDFVREKQIKSAAWFLLLLLILDLSTAGICSAGTIPGSRVPSDTTLRGVGISADSQPAQNADDDGCFCCCTHILPGVHFTLSPVASAVSVPSIPTLTNPSAFPQTLFHPPKH
jgi:hypothetical protein